MDITITHTATPELLGVLSALSNAITLNPLSGGVQKTDKKEPNKDIEKSTNAATPKKEEKAETDKPPVDAPLSLEAVRAEMAKKIEAGKRSEVKAILDNFGVEKLTDVPQDQYQTLLDSIRGL